MTSVSYVFIFSRHSENSSLHHTDPLYWQQFERLPKAQTFAKHRKFLLSKNRLPATDILMFIVYAWRPGNGCCILKKTKIVLRFWVKFTHRSRLYKPLNTQNIILSLQHGRISHFWWIWVGIYKRCFIFVWIKCKSYKFFQRYRSFTQNGVQNRQCFSSKKKLNLLLYHTVFPVIDQPLCATRSKVDMN